ncbi:MAG: hypothetical protein O2904_03295 [bacterium]|nr:hypothetical protein [bacterium]
MFNLPIVKRSAFCKTIGLLVGIAVAMSLPAEIVEAVPMIRAAAVVNILIASVFVAVMGLFTHHPVFKKRIHPLVRGGVIAAFVHVDFVIYMWPNQSQFWMAIGYAFAFGAVLDMLATQLFGEGKVLTEGITNA